MSYPLEVKLQFKNSLEPIMKLAGVNKLSDEFSDIEGFADDLDVSGIGEVLQRRRAKELEQAREEAADAILLQLRFGKDKIEQLRLQLQQLRIQEAKVKKTIEDIAVAIAYGHETRNYVPLVVINNVGSAAVKCSMKEAIIGPEDYNRIFPLAVINNVGSAAVKCSMKEAIISPEDYNRILTNIKKKKADERQQKKEVVATKTTAKARTVSS